VANDVRPFHIQVHHLDGSARVELQGEVDILAADDLRDALRGLTFRYDADQITIDCSRLSFIDLSAIGQLIALSNRLAGGRPALSGVPPFLARVLRITGVIDRFTLELALTDANGASVPA
jgi:anti-anti-sigma factor